MARSLINRHGIGNRDMALLNIQSKREKSDEFRSRLYPGLAGVNPEALRASGMRDEDIAHLLMVPVEDIEACVGFDQQLNKELTVLARSGGVITEENHEIYVSQPVPATWTQWVNSTDKNNE